MRKLFLLCLLVMAASSSVFAQCTGPANDCDGDGILDYEDLDNDNDGILDSAETSSGIIQWSAAQLNSFLTTPFTANMDCGTPLSFQANPLNSQLRGFSSSTAYNFNNILSSDRGMPTTIPRVMGFGAYKPNNGNIGNITVKFNSGSLYQLNLFMADQEYTSFVITAFDAANNPLSTADWQLATYKLDGSSPSTALGPFTNNGTNITYTATGVALNFDAIRVRVNAPALKQVAKIVFEARRSYNSSQDDGVFFFVSGICAIDTDLDGTPDYLDTDSDNDGCPDAIEGGAAFNYSNLSATGRLLGAVNAQGVPTIAGSPQTKGNSAAAALFDANSWCAFPESYNVINDQLSIPGKVSLGSEPLQGSDEADLPSVGSWVGRAIVITNLPTNGFILKYNDLDVVSNQVIANYKPDSLSIEPGITTPANATSTVFGFSTIDIADQQDATHADYTVNWATVLPVKLISFKSVSADNCSVQLFWETADELDMSRYLIQQSTDGISFFTVADITAQKEKNGVYNHKLNGNEAGAFYRLRMENNDGTFSYSRNTYFKSKCKAAIALAISPNPASSNIVLSGISLGDNLLIVDATGRGVISRKAKSANNMTIDISQLNTGLYYITVVREAKTITLKFVKK